MKILLALIGMSSLVGIIAYLFINIEAKIEQKKNTKKLENERR